MAPAGATRRLMGGELSALPGRHGADAPERGRVPAPRQNAAGPPVPGGRVAPTPSAVCGPASGPLVPRCRACGRGPLRFLRTTRPLLRRGPCPCARPLRRGPPGPRFAAPVRRMRPPSLRSVAGAGPRRVPPALSLGPCAPLRGSAGTRWPRCAWGRPPFAAGFLRCAAVALALCRPPRCASRGPAGSPLRRPLRGFGAGGLRPGGPARPFGPLVLASGPPGLFVLAAPARLRWHIRAGLSSPSKRPASRAGLDSPPRLCSGVDKALPGRAATPDSMMPPDESDPRGAA